ncbi:MAG TPA: hypothetical protein DCX89_07490 [Saprospirales bacterium]|nr:hypothetical protein [Saprospirales bacterium]HAY71720.1 hypothetical protein [Saprospirales bacterium]
MDVPKKLKDHNALIFYTLKKNLPKPGYLDSSFLNTQASFLKMDLINWFSIFLGLEKHNPECQVLIESGRFIFWLRTDSFSL